MNNFPLTPQRAEAYRDALARQDRDPIAFVAVTPNEDCPGIHAALGITVANERGYSPVPLGWARFETWEAAQENADEMNKHLGVGGMEAVKIVASTMGGMRYVDERAKALEKAFIRVLEATNKGEARAIERLKADLGHGDSA